MNLDLDLQLASDADNLPRKDQLQCWVEKALSGYRENAEVTIRIVDSAESQSLNASYRGKDKPTNVLSFPFEAPEGIQIDLLGDLVICAPVVETEAGEQNKSTIDHWAHMVIHGILHLLGFDHIDENDAQEMETLEIQLLSDIGIPNPYEDNT
ncbi:rRNA maturation RNase YbeY [Motiliproteus sp. MSK22-1]|uniref:rRNA maturation RNase YbeY n=1 Tax=Motiliproteus sp. MSK22-1 TaxID=1897630 RepID=UPI0009780EF0|nr:rRNA maturation RNase YbeY [Motiliproteus sp. MSK22-1]OMH33715.1 rRNA maturation RNase YbeY [Motiliproteus sp. MSK22-1]